METWADNKRGPCVAYSGAGMQPRLKKNLKAVEDSQHHPAALRELADGLHYRREPRNRSGTQIVPISEAARQDNGVAIGKVLRLVPDELYGLFEDVADGVKRVVIAVGARKDNYSKFHAVIAPWGIWGKVILPHPAHASPAFQNPRSGTVSDYASNQELASYRRSSAIQVERTFWQVLIWQRRRVIPNAGNRRTSDTRQ